MSDALRDLADADGLIPRETFAAFRHPRQAEADRCLDQGSVLFADSCRDLAYFDGLLEDWDNPFTAGLVVPDGAPNVFEVVGVTTDEFYAEPSLVLVQALANGAFVEVLLSDVIPQSVTPGLVRTVEETGRRSRRDRRSRNRSGDRVLRLVGQPIPSEFGTTAGSASVVMVNAVVQGTRPGEDGGRDVFIETQISFLTPGGDMVVGYDKVRTGTAITGWTWDECYGPGYEPEGWGSTACKTTFAIPSTGPPVGGIDIAQILVDRTSQEVWGRRGTSDGSGRVTGGTTRAPSAQAGEVLTIGAASISGCEVAISDSNALRETVSNGICALAGLAGAAGGMEAAVLTGPFYAFAKSTLTLGGPEVAVEDIMGYTQWLVAEGYEMGVDFCNAEMNVGFSLEVTGCQLDVLNNREGAENAACQSGTVRATFTIGSADECGGRSATCDAMGEQTCAMEGDCDTCSQEWEDALCTCN
ncbi:MAG: hypothetical protein AAGI52_13015 [Bacteroidota bacterium]